MTAEEGAALMSRAVKLGMAVANIFFEAAEERREDGVLILLRKGVNLTAIELGIVTLAVNDAGCTANQARIYFAAFILKTVESTLSQIRRRRARGTSGLWPSSP